MTAVDRPDNGQDEGRPGYVKAGRYWVPVEPLTFTCCGAPNPGICHQYGLCRQRGTHPSVARAGAGEQQREQVARWLFAHDGAAPGAWDRMLSDAGKRVWLDYADELLALLGGLQPDGEAGR